MAAHWVNVPGTPMKMSGYSQAAQQILMDRRSKANCLCPKAVKKKTLIHARNAKLKNANNEQNNVKECEQIFESVAN